MGRRRRGAQPRSAGRDHRRAHLRPQHHDVDEAGGQSRSPSSRIARCRSIISPTTPRASPRSSRNTARAAPGTRMPAPAACTCARFSTCGRTKTSMPCARSPKRPSPWCANTRARIPANTATAWCARNSTSRCSARGWRAPSRRSRTASTPRASTIRARWCGRRNSTTAALFRYAPGYHGEDVDHASRLVGFSRRRRRVSRRDRDVQQQRRLPQTCRRRHVPELSRHPRRARRHSRPRQYVAPRRHRPAWTGRARLRRDGRDAQAMRLLQGLPARMPDRRRHGAHEDRSAGGARRETRAFAARPAGRLAAALRAARRETSVAAQYARPAASRCAALSELFGGFAARRSLPKWRADIYRDRSDWSYNAAPESGDQSREVVLFADTFNRYFERENLDAASARAHRRRLSRACGAAAGRR